MAGSASQGDQLRQRGEAAYRKTLQWAAGNAEQLDNYWNRYARSCVATATRELRRQHTLDWTGWDR